MEDKLFTKLVSNPGYTYMDLLNDSAKKPLSSFLATMPESYYHNNLERGVKKLESLEKAIEDESFSILKNERSLNEANQSLVEVTRTRDAMKAEYEATARMVENIEARQDGYSSAAEKTRGLKQQHELKKQVAAMLQDAMHYICNVCPGGDILPYSKYSSDDIDELAEIFELPDLKETVESDEEEEDQNVEDGLHIHDNANNLAQDGNSNGKAAIALFCSG